MDLIEPLKQPNHLIFMDNFYTHITIAEKIYEQKRWGFTGSLKATRIPLEMKKIKFSDMKVHGKNIYTKGTYCVILYNDKKKRARNLFMMTNCYSTETVIKVKNSIRPIPECFLKYHSNYGTVDTHNQFTSYYRYPHKTKKWWKAVFVQFLEMSIVNAWIIYRDGRHRSVVKQKHFRLGIIEEWLEEYRRFKEKFVNFKDCKK